MILGTLLTINLTTVLFSSTYSSGENKILKGVLLRHKHVITMVSWCFSSPLLLCASFQRQVESCRVLSDSLEWTGATHPIPHKTSCLFFFSFWGNVKYGIQIHAYFWNVVKCVNGVERTQPTPRRDFHPRFRFVFTGGKSQGYSVSSFAFSTTQEFSS